MKHINLHHLTTLLLSLLLIISFVVYINFVDHRIESLINSDDASELIYARLLASEDRFISNNWYASTELRILHNQIIYSLLFKVTNNWHTIRVVSYSIIYIFVLVSYFLLCQKLNLGNLFFLGGLLLVLPFSTTYFDFMLRVPYYTPFVCVSFITIFLCCYYTNTKNIFSLVLSIILACFASLNGVRQAVNLYFPLFITSFIILYLDKKQITAKRIKTPHINHKFGPIRYIRSLVDTLKQSTFYYLFLFSFLSLLASCIGIVINSFVLSKYFHFFSYSHIAFSDLNPERLFNVLYDIICSFGYLPKKSILSMALVYNTFCFSWITLTIFSIFYSLECTL